MCALCGMLVDGPHWTESGTNAGRSNESKSEHARLLDRSDRVKTLNTVLQHYGCAARELSGNQYVVQNLSGGASEIIFNLPQLWQAMENISRRVADPLDVNLIEYLEEGATTR